MKRLFLAFGILAIATAFTNRVLAGLKDAKNKAECEKAGGDLDRERQQMRGQGKVKLHIALFLLSRHD